jgi:hypothetical protein
MVAQQTSILENRLQIPDTFNTIATPADEAVTTEAPVISQPVEKIEDSSYLSYLLEALETAFDSAEMLRDEGTKVSFKAKLLHSGVNGSAVVGIRTLDDVVAMFTAAKNWRMVFNADEQVDVFQAVLPKEYPAYAGYVTLNEIAEMYGDSVLDTVKLKIGRIDGQVYGCTVQQIETDVLTVQIRKDGNKIARVDQWFAGVDLKVRLMNPAKTLGDAIVRCGVKILPIIRQKEIAAQKRAKQERWKQSGGQARR